MAGNFKQHALTHNSGMEQLVGLAQLNVRLAWGLWAPASVAHLPILSQVLLCTQSQAASLHSLTRLHTERPSMLGDVSYLT